MVFDKAGSSFHLVLMCLTGSAGSEPVAVVPRPERNYDTKVQVQEEKRMS